MADRCRTRYPIVLIHGTGFRDNKAINYWGRIPKALVKEGAEIYYGHQDCWGTIEHNAAIIKTSIEKVVSETGAEKVNLIAHSKGGLEARYLISSLGMSDQIASLTTIATPHHGSKTMDMICKLHLRLFKIGARFVNLWFRVIGDQNPDFQAVCKQFTTYFTEQFNVMNLDADDVYYQSYAAVMKNSFSDISMIIPHFVISCIEGENDGLVTPDSAAWTNFRGVMRGSTNRGISHADEVDMRRMKFCSKIKPGYISDICDAYLQIVSDIKCRGY
ncbi:MAG: hypothetical protein AAGU75_15035 [Bacillota bacterium]